MGTALLSELAHHTRNETYAFQAARDVLNLQRRLLKDTNKFILQHGYNDRHSGPENLKKAQAKTKKLVKSNKSFS